MLLAGSSIADDLIVVLMGTNMFISGAVAFILDNTIKGLYQTHYLEAELIT